MINRARKYNKSSTILAYLEANPYTPADKVARKFGLNIKTIYSYRWRLGMQRVESAENDGGTQVIEPKEDMVNHPPHYTNGGIETIDYLRAKLTPEEFHGYCRGNALKYMSRAGMKDNTTEDYAKAAWYLNELSKALS